MNTFDRRRFLSLISRSAGACAIIPIISGRTYLDHSRNSTREPSSSPQSYKDPATSGRSCWLDLCAPFIVEDSVHGLRSEVVLTSDTFVGASGCADGGDATEYEFYLYDADGRAIGSGGTAAKLTVPAMQTTVIRLRDLIAPSRNFWGGMTIRLRPAGREPMHATDLFSSAFIRWQTDSSFDNVHANPDPLQWQTRSNFYYSMPFPPLSDYECTVGIFNPYATRGAGRIAFHDPLGAKVLEVPYDLKPRSSALFALNQSRFSENAYEAFGLARGRDATVSANAPAPRPGVRAHHVTESESVQAGGKRPTDGGGLLVIRNNEATMKSFAYLIIKKNGRDRFSVEHPIHQPVTKPLPSTAPFDADARFKAKNILFSPLLFRAKRLGPITLNSRIHLSTGLPYEEALWLAPYAVDSKGSACWLASKDEKVVSQLPKSQWQRGAIRLGVEQSCVLDFSRLSLDDDFSGGLCLAIAPDSTHTFMKVEVRVPEWGAHAFTHFRPGLRAARGYQAPKQRGGLATDYLTSGARFERRGSKILFDEFIGVINIDDREVEGAPILELFGPKGLVARIKLAPIPGFGCRHFLLSDLIKEQRSIERMSMRLIDQRATLLMSTVHIDYTRRDIALDHGSDRFSTFTDYNCSSPG